MNHMTLTLQMGPGSAGYSEALVKRNLSLSAALCVCASTLREGAKCSRQQQQPDQLALMYRGQAQVPRRGPSQGHFSCSLYTSQVINWPFKDLRSQILTTSDRQLPNSRARNGQRAKPGPRCEVPAQGVDASPPGAKQVLREQGRGLAGHEGHR